MSLSISIMRNVVMRNVFMTTVVIRNTVAPIIIEKPELELTSSSFKNQASLAWGLFTASLNFGLRSRAQARSTSNRAGQIPSTVELRAY
jgi:hypothetical protein